MSVNSNKYYYEEDIYFVINGVFNDIYCRNKFMFLRVAQFHNDNGDAYNSLETALISYANDFAQCKNENFGRSFNFSKILYKALVIAIADIYEYVVTKDIFQSITASVKVAQILSNPHSDDRMILNPMQLCEDSVFHEEIRTLSFDENIEYARKAGARHDLVIMESLQESIKMGNNNLTFPNINKIGYTLFGWETNSNEVLADMTERHTESIESMCEFLSTITSYEDVKYIQRYITDCLALDNIEDLTKFSTAYREIILDSDITVQEKQSFIDVTLYAEQCIILWYKMQ